MFVMEEMMANWTMDTARATFLNYFKERGHTIVASSPLLPAEDKTLLFTNAGMNQFKNLFLGQEKRSYTRAVTAQKCVRAGGKHNDLENVGFTARHHTFFEMLGNFSFGDYFKKEAIAFAWELVTDKKYYGLDKNRLYVTIYKDDDEAFEIWNKQEKVPAERIFRLGEKDNFWSMGDTGPCGPCSEIHYDMWDNYTAREHFTGNEPDWDCGRFVEIWNLVFMQFDRDAAGTLTPLPKPSIDTGMGLERITAALCGVATNYDTDLFAKLIAALKEMRGGAIDPAQEASWRVIADHARATSFLIADSITPSNEGRGYVLRRIMRRAIRHGHKLGFTELFFHKACDIVITLMGPHYGELKNQREMILAIASEEEKRFRQTLDKGLALLNDGVAAARKAKVKTLPGDLVFKLYDTYGFPPDLTQTILAEQGFSYDTAGYDAAMKEQQERGKASWSGGSEEKKLAAAKSLHDDGIGETKFEGYDKSEMTGELLALFNGELDRVDSVRSGGTAYAILSPLLFYAESGGQVGDKGTLEKDGAVVATVTDCVKLGEYRAAVVSAQGDIVVGTRLTQKLEEERRGAIRRNHSATHLLHLALKKALGDHAHQSGSLVTQERLRFDFAHFKAVSPDELRAIELEVNRLIQQNYKTCTEIKAIEEAKKEGAMALFGEKYGEEVRVVSMGESKELCGGTHVERTGEIGSFKILKEEGIAAGVRRIEAVTGMAAVRLAQELERLVAQAAEVAGGEKGQLVAVLEKQRDERKTLQKRIEELEGKLSALEAKDMKPAVVKEGVAVYILDTGKGRSEVIQLSDSLKGSVSDGLFILTGVDAGAAVAVISASGKGKERYDCGKLLKELLAEFGGRGGGKKDMAQGGAPQIDFARWQKKSLELVG